MDQNNEPPRINFEGEEFQQPRSFQTPKPKIVKWVMQYSGGYIKDEKQAQYVLLIAVGIAVLVAITAPFVLGGGSASKPLPWKPPAPEAYPKNWNSGR
ncbi:MAG: hypothetical protein QG636_144 [Patescibacteria group bacterium]|nr:hypothetical protein [Patescibacteria group bacterium]